LKENVIGNEFIICVRVKRYMENILSIIMEIVTDQRLHIKIYYKMLLYPFLINSEGSPSNDLWEGEEVCHPEHEG
jgi:hypothetical protein